MSPLSSTPQGGLSRISAVYLPALVAALGGLLFGFDTAVINGAIVYLKRQLNLSARGTEFAAGSILLGCALGSALAGYLGDRFGRKRLLLVSAAIFAVSSVAAAMIVTLPQFLIARFAGGIAIGLASMLAPLYISELAPAAIRGRLVTLNQLAIVSGVLLAFFSNYLLSGLGNDSWRWMFGCAAFPAILFFVSMLFIPESPRWLIQRGQFQEAERILIRTLGMTEAAVEAGRIRETIAHEQGSLWEPKLRRPLTIAIVLAALQQLTGINTILYYGSLVFVEQIPHQSDSSALLSNIAIGATNLAFTLVAMFLVDRAGRKPLLVITSAAMAIFLLALSIAAALHAPASLLLVLIMLYVASFATGMGPVVWIVMSEIFPANVRAQAVALGNVVLWLACALITFTFLSLVSALSISGAFLLYAALSVVASLFVARVLPETKGRTLEEIEAGWRAKGRSASASVANRPE